MLAGIVFALVSFIAPYLRSLKYIFPNGYAKIYGQVPFKECIAIQLLLFAAFGAALYAVSLSSYRKLEY